MSHGRKEQLQRDLQERLTKELEKFSEEYPNFDVTVSGGITRLDMVNYVFVTVKLH